METWRQTDACYIKQLCIENDDCQLPTCIMNVIQMYVALETNKKVFKVEIKAHEKCNLSLKVQLSRLSLLCVVERNF